MGQHGSMNPEKMRRVSAKLAVLTALYERVKAARANLKEEIARTGYAPPDLTSAVDLLHTQCGKALEDLQAEYAAKDDAGQA